MANRVHFRISVAAVILGMCALQPARSGGMDTHLTATYYMAIQAGYTHDDARLIALGNWSMDLNSTTSALPTIDPPWENSARGLLHDVNSPGKTKDWYVRGRTYHTLAKGPIEARNSLVSLRDDLTKSSANRDDRLIQLGQYLHATQDAYFHQDQNGQPFNEYVGHAKHGHDQDSVKKNFYGALRANAQTHDILKQYKQSGALPPVPPANEIYKPIDIGEVRAILSRDKSSDVVGLTRAIANSYSGDHVDPVKLGRNVTDAWLKQAPGTPIRFEPPTQVDKFSVEKIDYDGKHNHLLLNRPAASDLSKLKAVAPGGISLSRAAAGRMALQIDLDGLVLDRGRVVLSGRPSRERSMDAALFMTAMRAACGPDEPYFSLDAVDGSAWIEEGNRAADEIWQRIRGDFGWDAPVARTAREGLTVRAVSVRRDYPDLWARIGPRYPNLKTKLVFRPTWLKDTRFGEILYKADVILKELSGGTQALSFDAAGLQALKVERYVSADFRRVAQLLYVGLDNSVNAAQQRAPFRSSRLWFDLASDGRDSRIAPGLMPVASMLEAPVKRLDNPVLQKLEAIMRARGYIDRAGGASVTRTGLATHGDAMDLSAVFPQMFVRAHDFTLGKDVDGTEPTTSALANDVSLRIERYVAAYKELQDLTDVFRLYVAAVGLVARDRSACATILATPLLAGERLSAPLPDFLRSELMFSVAAYTYSTAGSGRRVHRYQVSSVQGGVAPRGRSFVARETSRQLRTAITDELTREAEGPADEPIYKGSSGRSYAALILDSAEDRGRLVKFAPMSEAMLLARLAGPGSGGASIDQSRGMLDDDARPAGLGRNNSMLEGIAPEQGRVIMVPAR